MTGDHSESISSISVVPTTTTIFQSTSSKVGISQTYTSKEITSCKYPSLLQSSYSQPSTSKEPAHFENIYYSSTSACQPSS